MLAGCLLQVRQGVETRVKEALTRAQLLEKQQELTAAQHAEQLEQLMQQQADLEAALGQASKEQSEARHQLAKAEAAGECGRVTMLCGVGCWFDAQFDVLLCTTTCIMQ